MKKVTALTPTSNSRNFFCKSFVSSFLQTVLKRNLYEVGEKVKSEEIKFLHLGCIQVLEKFLHLSLDEKIGFLWLSILN